MENSFGVKVLTYYDITKSDKKQIRELWEKSFEKNEDDDMELIDSTVVIVIEENKNIRAMSFLLLPTREHFSNENLNIKSYENIKEQGVSEDDCYIYNFCVSKENRKKGIGKFLLEKCHQYANEMKKENVFLFVEQGNIPAICLYNKFKYQVHRAAPNGFILKKYL